MLDRDIPPQAGRVPVSEDIRATCVTFEVVRSRFVDRKAVGWPSFVADNVGFEALVVSDSLGAGIDIPLLAELAQTTEVYVDGECRARGLSGDAATDPLVSLAHLYAHAAERGQTLKAGDVVTTGAMCQPFEWYRASGECQVPWPDVVVHPVTADHCSNAACIRCRFKRADRGRQTLRALDQWRFVE